MYVQWTPDNPEEISDQTPGLLREAYDYYRTSRGQHACSTNRMLMTGIDRLMAFSAVAQIGTLLQKPLLLIAGDQADTLYFSREAYEAANEPKELFLVAGASHVDLYDKPQYVSQVVDRLKEFFGKNL